MRRCSEKKDGQSRNRPRRCHAGTQDYELSGALADYLVPTACEIPNFEIIAMHTPNRRNPIGSKGTAEGGVMGAIGAIGNAVNDALAPLGIEANEQPFSPEYLRSKLRR